MDRKKGAGFIVFEGIDGSGQSTQAELLRDFLLENGYEVILTHEPTLDSEAGRKAYRVLNKEINVSLKELQELITKDRKEHLENTIIPTLKEGKVVISDRYFFSTFAYGGSGGLGLDWLIEINSSYLYPDIVFLLKVSPKVSIDRIFKRGKKVSIFEKKEKLEAIWNLYKTLPKRFKNINVINGEKSVKKVFEDIKKIIVEKSANWR
jgi:dTMP kinase